MDRRAMTDPLCPALVLTIEEMQAVARPHTEPAAMVRWFHENGFTFKTAPDGYPVVLRQHFEEAMGSYGRRVRRSFKSMDLSGKDYISRKEAAHYCCVSESQFERKEVEYGIPCIPFMGKLIYRRVDLQRLIESEWQQYYGATRPGTGSASGVGRVSAAIAEFRRGSRRKQMVKSTKG
jgi:hypothetical protein